MSDIIDIEQNRINFKAKILEEFDGSDVCGKEKLADLLSYMLCDFEIPKEKVLEAVASQVLEIENQSIDENDAKKLEIAILKRKYAKCDKALTKQADLITSLEDRNDGLERKAKRIKRLNKRLITRNKELVSLAETTMF